MEATKRSANRPYLPYDRATCDMTWRQLVRRFAAGGGVPMSLDFADEQALVDAVHTSADAAMIDQFERPNGRSRINPEIRFVPTKWAQDRNSSGM